MRDPAERVLHVQVIGKDLSLLETPLASLEATP